MKYFPRLKLYKASNCSFNPETLTALSYNWWPMLARINGKLVRNVHNYSQSTCGHQGKLRRLLDRLDIQPDVRLDVRADIRKGSTVAAELVNRWAKEEVRLKYARIKRANAWSDQIEAARSLGLEYEVSESMRQWALELAERYRREKLDTKKSRRAAKPVVYPPLRLVQ